MKLYSWNVNGLRAVIKKGFFNWFDSVDADVVNLQEIKAQPEQLKEDLNKFSNFNPVWNPSKKKKGYAGVASFSKIKPLKSETGIPKSNLNGEGRLILEEYDKFFLFNIYYPNGQMNDERLKFKLDYYNQFLDFSEVLRKSKPIVVCGDFNTAHKAIDLKNPKANEKTSGFLPIEREWLDLFISKGYIDTFRMFNKEPHNYTWWSYRMGARQRNVGWRIDYFFVSDELKDNVIKAWIEPEVVGSDHCPIGLELKF